MDKKFKRLVLVISALFVYQQYQIIYLTKLHNELCDVLAKQADDEFQEAIDDIFEDIANNYDE